jgi:hypothetical protein
MVAGGCATLEAPSHAVKMEMRNRLPVVRVTIFDQPAWMLVDSGASYHAISGRLARKLAQFTVDVGDATDLAGGRHDVRLSTSLQIDAGEWALVRGRVLITEDTSASFGGRLSPQWLARDDETVVVDLVTWELRGLPAQEAAERYGSWPGVLIPRGESCTPMPGFQRFGVRATIGGKPVRLEIDSGSNVTALDADRDAGRALTALASSRPSTVSLIGGASIDVARLAPQPLLVGEIARTVEPMLFHRSKPDLCEFDGVLGTDALKNCAILFDRDGVQLRCLRN